MEILGTPASFIAYDVGSVNDRNQQPTSNASARPTAGTLHPRRRVQARISGIGVALTLLAVAVAGCASNTPSSSSSSSIASSSASSTPKSSISTSYPPGKEQICQARDQLRTSISTLTDQSLLAA